MTVRANVRVETLSKTIEILGGESEPAVVVFNPRREIETAALNIAMKGDLGCNKEHIHVYVNGNDLGPLTTHEHNTTYKKVYGRSITGLVGRTLPITVEFKPTRRVNKLWNYAWGAIVTLNVTYPEYRDYGEVISMGAAGIATGNQMSSISQGLSAAGQNVTTSQQQTMVLHHAASVQGINTLMNIGSAVSGAVVEDVVGKNSD